MTIAYTTNDVGDCLIVVRVETDEVMVTSPNEFFVVNVVGTAVSTMVGGGVDVLRGE